LTAPDNSVLNGITRKHVIEICNEINIKIEYSFIAVKDIEKYDGVFMTGTSPMILPFSHVDDKLFKVKFPLIERIRKLYIQRAEASLSQFRPGI